jgi:hypothetical protein
MFWMFIALVTIPLGLGLILSVCGVEIVRGATDPNRKPHEVMGAAAGFLVGGFIGFVCSGAVAFASGLIPLFGDKGHPIAATLLLFAGVILFGVAGARFAQLMVRRAPRRRPARH